MTTSFKPSRSAVVTHTDKEIQVYSDGTWKPVAGSMRGWQVMSSAVVYAEGTGDARITTGFGRSKVSKVISPKGVRYDVRALATKGTA